MDKLGVALGFSWLWVALFVLLSNSLIGPFNPWFHLLEIISVIVGLYMLQDGINVEKQYVIPNLIKKEV